MIVVLKSLRTKEGAEGWKRAMKHYDALVVGDSALVEGGLTGFPSGCHHVVVEVFDNQIGEIIRSMVHAGYMEVTSGGVFLTSSWFECVERFLRDILKQALGVGDIPTEIKSVLKSIETITATIDAEFGHELRDNIPISDEEAKAGFTKPAPAADVRDPKMDGKAISESEVKAATYEGDHNLYKTFKSLDDAKAWKNPDSKIYHIVPASEEEKGKYGSDARYIVRARNTWYEQQVVKGVAETVAQNLEPKETEMNEDVQGTSNPIPADETLTQKLKERPTMTFKSLREAQAWTNPDPSRLYVRPTTPAERRELGARMRFIVDQLPERVEVGALGNRKVSRNK